MSVITFRNSILYHNLTILRNKKTDTASFRFASDTICEYLILESLKDIPFKKVTVETPFEKTAGTNIDENLVFILILRSGIAMLPPILKFFRQAKIGFAGLERDELTAVAHEYYWKLPKISKNTTVIICDPMLATGGSASMVVKKVRTYSPKRIKLITVIAVLEGINIIKHDFPDVQIYTLTVDRELNSHKYILPGVGDYGDRYFGTG
jgi:uracil phosphoribosyltransferase